MALRINDNISVYMYSFQMLLSLLHSEWPKLYRVLAILSAIGLNCTSLLNTEDIIYNFAAEMSFVCFSYLKN